MGPQHRAALWEQGLLRPDIHQTAGAEFQDSGCIMGRAWRGEGEWRFCHLLSEPRSAVVDVAKEKSPRGRLSQKNLPKQEPSARDSILLPLTA